MIRALAALRRDVRLVIVGAGPERARLLRYASDLGVSGRVEIRAVPYDEMPSVFASASCVVLASLPIPTWEEQFGLVLAEALAARAPIIASSSGAIPEVLQGSGAQLFSPGDWPELARLLDAGPLAGAPGERVIISDRSRSDDIRPVLRQSGLRQPTSECCDRLVGPVRSRRKTLRSPPAAVGKGRGPLSGAGNDTTEPIAAM